MTITYENQTVGSRELLLAGILVRERRVDAAGISTAVLESGDGPPLVLLHEVGAFAPQWLRVLPSLARTHRVIAPDLPGHGETGLGDEELDGTRVVEWVGELIASTCDEPPVLVGHLGSGAVAARFAIEHGDRLSGLVLVDSFGLGKFRPTPGFGLALLRYVGRPTARTYRGLMQRCTFDFDDVRDSLGDRWAAFEDYSLSGARSPEGKAALRVLMKEVAVPAIPEADLARIDVRTTLIWGRHDPVMRLRVAEGASERYGWSLHVIEEAGDDPPLEQPEAFLRALEASLR